MKTNTVYKRALNDCLDLLSQHAVGDDLGSEPHLARELGVSRTTVRTVLTALSGNGLISLEDGQKRILRSPVDSDYFPDIETEPVSTLVEKKFMEWMLHGDCVPGQDINGIELARQFGISSSAIREYLNRISHFGLLERRPNSSWVFKGFTDDFARELSDVRELFELQSARAFVQLPAADPAWRKLQQIERQHIMLLQEIDERYTDFSPLDDSFHKLIYGASRNRFFESFYDIISMIFHYHYLWNKADEKERNAVAIQEHLAYISALKSRDIEAVMITGRAHMKTARATLMRSIRRPSKGMVV